MRKATHKEKKEALLKVVKEMQSDIMQNIECINEGGCGHFANLFYKSCKEKYPSMRLVVFSIWGERFLRANKKEIKRWNCGVGDSCNLKHTSVGHVAVKVYGFTFDGEDILVNNATPSGRKPVGHYTEKELEVALKYGSWNNSYDTHQNKKLKTIISKHTNQL